MKFISWNIDSINAALTSDSARAVLTRDVLKKVAAEEADIIAIQETKLPAAGLNAKQEEVLDSLFPEYDRAWISSVEPARKGYAGTMALYKKGMDVTAHYPKIGAPEPMDLEGRMITLELPDFYFNLVYTPNAGDGLKRLGERQVWDQKYADYLSGLDAALSDVAGIVDLVESAGHRGCELSGCKDDTVDRVRISGGTNSVHDNGSDRNLTFVRLSAGFALDECGKKE